jgi:hypothetical protein
MSTTQLYAAADGAPFAYATDGKNFFLYSDNSYWAYRHDDHLYDAQSNQPIAYIVQNYVYALSTNEPLYYM